MSSDIQYEHEREDYSDQSGARYSRDNISQRRRTAQSRRRAKSPQSVNGLHRRRRKKISW